MKNLAKIIDQTNIRPEAKAGDIKKTVREAKEFGFRGVCVNPKWVKLTAQELKGAGVKTVVLIDGPMGMSSHQRRAALSKKAKKDGANELDIVLNIVDLKYERYQKVLADLKPLCRILPVKVIIGSGYLTDEEIIKAAELAQKAGAICVKTATFKDPLENRELAEKARHLKLMRKGAPGLLIKASGNIKTLKDVQTMIRAGADIVGTSSGVEIVRSWKRN
ncbi:MAG: deoxyribose-phosphate aldolase [Patescibacteria group bacterium]